MYSHGSFVFFLINSFYGSLKKAKLEIISRKPVRIMMIDRLVSSVEKCCLMVKKKYHNVGKNRVLHHRNWFDSAHTQDKVSVWSISLMLSLMTKQPAAHKKKWNEQQQQQQQKKSRMLDVKWIFILVSAWQTQIKTTLKVKSETCFVACLELT